MRLERSPLCGQGNKRELGRSGSGCGVGLLLWTVVTSGSLSGLRYLLALSILLGLAGANFVWATFRGPSDSASA